MELSLFLGHLDFGSFFFFGFLFSAPSSATLLGFLFTGGFELLASFLKGFSFSPPLILASEPSSSESSVGDPLSSLSATKSSSSSSLSPSPA
uniref:Nfd110 n=1 Tax=Arundo donax TaxID=35708 RepID=A0A0A9D279_ARUDO